MSNARGDQSSIPPRHTTGHQAPASYANQKIISAFLSLFFIFSVMAPVYAAPLAEKKQFETYQNQPVTIQLPGSDTEGKEIAFEIVNEPKHGTITDFDQSAGTFVYTPPEDFIGDDAVTYRVTTIETQTHSEPANIEITIKLFETQEPSPSPSATPAPTDEPLLHYEDLGEHWASYSAGKLGNLGIIVGEKVNNKYYFYPDHEMTRAEFALFLVHVLEIDPEQLSWSRSPGLFADEDQIPAWIRDEARAAKLAGVINGSEIDGQVYFNADEKITRAQAVTMLNNAAMPTSYNNDGLPFADADQIPEWAVAPVKNMLGWGLIDGFDDNTFRPDSRITRAQAAEMMWQLRKFNGLPDASARVAQSKGKADLKNTTLK